MAIELIYDFLGIFGHLDSRDAQLEGIEEMLKNLDENDLKVIYRIVRSFRG